MYSERIKKLRNEKELSQTELGNYLGVSASAVYKWENGKSQPDINSIIKMSKLFGVTTDFIIGADNERINMPKIEKSMREILNEDTETAQVSTVAAHYEGEVTEELKREIARQVKEGIEEYNKRHRR